jgi:hypothetical protein
MKKNIFKVWFDEFLKPWGCLNFYGYLIISIFFGGFGVFYTLWGEVNAEVFNSWKVAENLITYSLAILFPSLINIYGDNVEDVKGRNIWTIIVFIAIPSILAIMALSSKNWYMTVPCVFMSFIAWVIANHNNKVFSEETFSDFIQNETKDKHGLKWNNE